tara:strand:+ start:94 stop:633 length:540 start_codon:yes stop_codon:yes gene_type:complete
MKIKKSRLVKIIREEIMEARLRNNIRGAIREFVSTGTAAGAQKSGYQSADTKSKKSTYDTKSADYDTKSAAYDTKSDAVDDTKRYRKSTGKAKYTYSGRPIRGGETNPDWTTQTSERDAAETAKANAKTAKDSAETDWESAKEDDLQAEVPTQEPPTGGSAAYGSGKSAGKGKGKKKKD